MDRTTEWFYKTVFIPSPVNATLGVHYHNEDANLLYRQRPLYDYVPRLEGVTKLLPNLTDKGFYTTYNNKTGQSKLHLCPDSFPIISSTATTDKRISILVSTAKNVFDSGLCDILSDTFHQAWILTRPSIPDSDNRFHPTIGEKTGINVVINHSEAIKKILRSRLPNHPFEVDVRMKIDLSDDVRMKIDLSDFENYLPLKSVCISNLQTLWRFVFSGSQEPLDTLVPEGLYTSSAHQYTLRQYFSYHPCTVKMLLETLANMIKPNFKDDGYTYTFMPPVNTDTVKYATTFIEAFGNDYIGQGVLINTKAKEVIKTVIYVLSTMKKHGLVVSDSDVIVRLDSCVAAIDLGKYASEKELVQVCDMSHEILSHLVDIYLINARGSDVSVDRLSRRMLVASADMSKVRYFNIDDLRDLRLGATLDGRRLIRDKEAEPRIRSALSHILKQQGKGFVTDYFNRIETFLFDRTYDVLQYRHLDDHEVMLDEKLSFSRNSDLRLSSIDPYLASSLYGARLVRRITRLRGLLGKSDDPAGDEDGFDWGPKDVLDEYYLSDPYKGSQQRERLLEFVFDMGIITPNNAEDEEKWYCLWLWKPHQFKKIEPDSWLIASVDTLPTVIPSSAWNPDNTYDAKLLIPIVDGAEGIYVPVIGNPIAGWHFGPQSELVFHKICVRTGAQYTEWMNKPGAAFWTSPYGVPMKGWHSDTTRIPYADRGEQCNYKYTKETLMHNLSDEDYYSRLAFGNFYSKPYKVYNADAKPVPAIGAAYINSISTTVRGVIALMSKRLNYEYPEINHKKTKAQRKQLPFELADNEIGGLLSYCFLVGYTTVEEMNKTIDLFINSRTSFISRRKRKDEIETIERLYLYTLSSGNYRFVSADKRYVNWFEDEKKLLISEIVIAIMEWRDKVSRKVPVVPAVAPVVLPDVPESEVAPLIKRAAAAMETNNTAEMRVIDKECEEIMKTGCKNWSYENKLTLVVIRDMIRYRLVLGREFYDVTYPLEI